MEFPLQLKILVADDNYAAADLAATVFRMKDMTVEVAFDGEEALKAVEIFAPDVVLLDLGMPKLDGFEVCRRIRAREWGARPIILALSGTGRAEDRRLTMEAGFDDHLVKPVSPLELFEIIVDLAKRKFS